MEAILNQKTKHCVALWCFDNLLNVFWTNGRNVTQLAESFPRGIFRSSTHVERVCGMTGWLWLLLVVLRFEEQFGACSHLCVHRWLWSPRHETHGLEQWEHLKSLVWYCMGEAFLLQGWAFSMGPLRSCWTPSELLLARMCGLLHAAQVLLLWCYTTGGWLWQYPCIVSWDALGFACDAPAQHTIDVWACGIRLYGWHALPTASEPWWVLRRYWYNQ